MRLNTRSTSAIDVTAGLRERLGVFCFAQRMPSCRDQGGFPGHEEQPSLQRLSLLHSLRRCLLDMPRRSQVLHHAASHLAGLRSERRSADAASNKPLRQSPISNPLDTVVREPMDEDGSKDKSRELLHVSQYVRTVGDLSWHPDGHRGWSIPVASRCRSMEVRVFSVRHWAVGTR